MQAKHKPWAGGGGGAATDKTLSPQPLPTAADGQASRELVCAKGQSAPAPPAGLQHKCAGSRTGTDLMLSDVHARDVLCLSASFTKTLRPQLHRFFLFGDAERTAFATRA